MSAGLMKLVEKWRKESHSEYDGKRECADELAALTEQENRNDVLP